MIRVASMALFVWWMGVTSAYAQDDAVARRAARGLAEEGVRAAREHAWEQAREAFSRSMALFPSPITQMNLAGAEVQTGHLVAAAEHYRAFLREADGASLERYGEAVRAALATLEPRIPTWTIEVDLEPGEVLSLDGAPLDPAVIGVPLPVDPGAHTVAVDRGEARLTEAHFEAVASEHGDLTLRVARLLEAPSVVALEVPALEVPTLEVPASSSPTARDWLEPAPSSEAPRDDTALHLGIALGAAAVVLTAVAVGVGVALGAPSSAPLGNVDPIVVF